MPEKLTTKEKSAARRRGQILKAAAEVFTQKRLLRRYHPGIARLAGLAAGTLYLYFPNKRELFIAVVKETIITTPLLNLIGKIPTGNFADVFKRILMDRFELIRAMLSFAMPSLIGEVQRDPELKALWLKEFLQPFLGRMEMAYACCTPPVRRGAWSRR